MLICFLDQTTQGSWLKLTIIGATVDIEDMQAAWKAVLILIEFQ